MLRLKVHARLNGHQEPILVSNDLPKFTTLGNSQNSFEFFQCTPPLTKYVLILNRKITFYSDLKAIRAEKAESE